MKKITKAAIAGGLGVVLLAGGAGSLAYWTDVAKGPTADIQSGELSFGTIGDGDWMIQQNATGVNPAQAAAVRFVAGDKIVPGDVLTNTVSVPVTLEGKNIKAELGIDSVVTAVGGTPDPELAAALIIAIDPVDPVQLTAANTTVPVTITVTFPWGLEDQFNEAMNGHVTFTSDYTLTQIPVATP